MHVQFRWSRNEFGVFFGNLAVDAEMLRRRRQWRREGKGILLSIPRSAASNARDKRGRRHLSRIANFHCSLFCCSRAHFPLPALSLSLAPAEINKFAVVVGGGRSVNNKIGDGSGGKLGRCVRPVRPSGVIMIVCHQRVALKSPSNQRHIGSFLHEKFFGDITFS